MVAHLKLYSSVNLSNFLNVMELSGQRLSPEGWDLDLGELLFKVWPCNLIVSSIEMDALA